MKIQDKKMSGMEHAEPTSKRLQLL